MFEKMILYKYQGKLEELCKITIGVAFIILAIFSILTILGTFIIILSPEKELEPVSIYVLIIVYSMIIVTWWRIYKYYAVDIILSLKLKENIYNLRTYKKLYSTTKTDIILIKDSLFWENIVIVFKSINGKKYKKLFKKYITFGIKKVENFNSNTLKIMK